MKKLTGSTLAILLGIVIFLVGCIQPMRYETAIEEGYKVDAVIVRVVEREETDPDGPSSTSYTVYVDYEVDGKKYENVKAGKYYDTDDYYVGKTIQIVVNPESGGVMKEGGVLAVVGFVMIVGGIVSKVRGKSKKKKEENTEN